MEYWMIDYLNTVFPRWGLFESEGAALEWIETNLGEEALSKCKVFLIGVNDGTQKTVSTTSPFNMYAGQRYRG